MYLPRIKLSHKIVTHCNCSPTARELKIPLKILKNIGKSFMVPIKLSQNSAICRYFNAEGSSWMYY